MRRRKKQQLMFLFGVFAGLLSVMTVGYAVFSTNLNINVKGNLKDIKTVTDEKVPKEGLIFWGQADNSNNTESLLEDKSGNENNMTIHGASFNEEGLSFDGIDDYGVIEMLNYNNSKGFTIDFVAQVFEDNETDILFESSSDYNNSNGGYVLDSNDDLCEKNGFVLGLHYSIGWNLHCTSAMIDNNNFKHYTISFDTQRTYNQFTKIYMNQVPYNTQAVSQFNTNISNYTLTTYPLYIASRGGKEFFTNMILKEVIIYNRALTDDEVITINEGYQKKYKLK